MNTLYKIYNTIFRRIKIKNQIHSKKCKLHFFKNFKDNFGDIATYKDCKQVEETTKELIFEIQELENSILF